MDKKRFRVEKVPADAALPAQRLEDAMNLLDEEGYEVELLPSGDGGMFVLGTYAEDIEEAATSVAQLMLKEAAAEGSDLDRLTDSARELLLRFFRSTEEYQKPENLRRLTASQVQSLTRGYSLQALTEAAEEFENLAVMHAAKHQDPDCTFHPVLRVVASLVRESVRTRIQ